MEQATTIGLDIAKHVFQVHGADGAGHVLFRKRITRVKLLGFLAAQARCVVAMEACAGAHYWAREIAKLGHHVRLIAPAYVKPSSSGRRMMPPMQRPSVKRRSGRACALFRSRAKNSRRMASCSEPAISWCVSAPSASTLCAGT
jgi:transposase